MTVYSLTRQGDPDGLGRTGWTNPPSADQANPVSSLALTRAFRIVDCELPLAFQQEMLFRGLAIRLAPLTSSRASAFGAAQAGLISNGSRLGRPFEIVDMAAALGRGCDGSAPGAVVGGEPHKRPAARSAGCASHLPWRVFPGCTVSNPVHSQGPS